MRKNVEVEMLEQGDKLHEYECLIIPDSKDNATEAGYSLLFLLD